MYFSSFGLYNFQLEEPEDSPFQASAIAGKGECRYYAIKSASGQKNTKNFWWPKIPKTTAFNNPAKPLMIGKRIDLAGIQNGRVLHLSSERSLVLKALRPKIALYG